MNNFTVTDFDEYLVGTLTKRPEAPSSSELNRLIGLGFKLCRTRYRIWTRLFSFRGMDFDRHQPLDLVQIVVLQIQRFPAGFRCARFLLRSLPSTSTSYERNGTISPSLYFCPSVRPSGLMVTVLTGFKTRRSLTALL